MRQVQNVPNRRGRPLGACAGLRVLELGRGLAGPLAAMVLADFGADVVRVEPPGGDFVWEEPVALLVHRGKRSIDLDLSSEAGVATLYRLADSTDVFVDALDPGEAGSLGLAAEDLTDANPRLVHCSITGFGSRGPLATVRADDALVHAKAGIFRDQPGSHRSEARPVYRGTREPSFAAGLLAVEGILSALRVREATGLGQRVETSLLQALGWRLNPFVRWLLPDREDPPNDGGYGIPIPNGPAPLGSQLTGMMLETKDGRWIVHMLFERDFFSNWVHVLGMDWIWGDDRFRGAPHAIADPAQRVALSELLAARMKEKSATEWMELYVANGQICADVVQSTQEALQHPQMVQGGFLAEVHDPRVGRVVQVGPLAKIPSAPAAVRPAPRPGEHTESFRQGPVIARQTLPVSNIRSAGPLEGLTVIDAAIFYATCAGTAQLSDLGARVIKVEPISGDPYRRAARGMGRDNLVRSVQGKESIAIDLKESRGQEILHRLVAGADAFVHNFRAGVSERLGADEETLRNLNPRLVYLYAGSYGSTGPYRGQPAIDHVIAAFAGTTAHQMGADNSPLREQGADPVASLGVGAALMLGLAARERTGEGQYVESAMIQSNIMMNLEDALVYNGKPARRSVDHLQLGTGATHRLYETAAVGPEFSPETWENPNPRWVFLTAVSDEDFRHFCGAVGRDDLLADARFTTACQGRRTTSCWPQSSKHCSGRVALANGRPACSGEAWGVFKPTGCRTTRSYTGHRRHRHSA